MDSARPAASSNVAVPPTTNELNPHEKAILLRKTRKLSRVFGEVPSSIQQASHFHPHAGVNGHTSSASSSSSSHRRSVSSLSTVASQSSSKRRQAVRKAPSQPNIRASVVAEADEPEPSPRLSSSQVAKDTESPSSPSSPAAITTGPASLDQIHRIRLAKLKRRLGEDALPSDILTPSRRQSKAADDLRFRKSLDTMPMTRSASRNSSVKHLRRTRSGLPDVPKKPEPPIDDPVAFHRRYVQNFGCEGRVTQASRNQTNQAIFDQEPPQYVDVVPKLPPVPSKPLATAEQQHPQSVGNMFTVAGAMGDDFDPPGAVTKEEHEAEPEPDRDDPVVSPESAELPSHVANAFQERRRRAAKLAQFFGVGYHDISSSLPISDLVSHSSYRPSPQSNPAVQVDITMKSRRFWGSGDERWTHKDADMVDVIDKLRDLRA
ncbi:hypothetical protein V5O48_001733 [Marasmius crinis-equi]|uniref:Uncharacterized protein n=1 Tax=Marasmius crinis-equi TaxID=585013 RepID=A0ABR3FXR2_9AGAR